MMVFNLCINYFYYIVLFIFQRQEETKKKEMELIKNMRQQTIHKPEPIKKYKPVYIRKSVKPVTVPQSPRFSIRPSRNCLNSVCE